MIALLLALGCCAPQAAAPDLLQPGPWRAELASPGGALAFGLWFDAGEDPLAIGAEVVNGRERRALPPARLAGGELVLRFDPYDAELRARPSRAGTHLEGTWTKQSAGRRVRLPFRADALPMQTGEVVDPAPAAPAGEPPDSFGGRWSVRFAQSPDAAVAEFECGPASDPWMSGTFLTTLGDYRFLDGRWSGDGFTLSCFDGAHAFLFAARRTAEGGLSGDFWSGDTWHETWSALRDPAASLPDAFGLTRAAEDVDLGALTYPDLEGVPRRLDDAAFAGRARILQVFGTWCPNCNDEAPFLAELDRRYRAHGLAVLGLAFEHGDDHAYAAGRARAYAERHGVAFPILIAGTSDKQKASEAFPLVDRVRAFPTTLFLDAQGRVRAVHTGFSGPATGPEHARLKAEFERLIEELLAEAAR